MPRTLSIMTLDASRSVLDFVHRLLCRAASEQPSLEGLLEELATAFAASCGLVSLPDGGQTFRHPEPAPGPWPWSDDPSLLDGTARPPGAVIVQRLDRPALLLTTVAGPS